MAPDLDDRGRLALAPEDRSRITTALAAIPAGKHGAFVAIADRHGPRGMFAVNLGRAGVAEWKVVGGLGVHIGRRPDGYIGVEATW